MADEQIVIIGGVGGSGTRAVAEVVNSLGVFLGSNLNDALDNLDWPGRQIAPVIRDRSKRYEESYPEVADVLIDFAQKMKSSADTSDGLKNIWGTKVPGSFFYLRHLSDVLANVRYIHVIRHGLDMAFSSNHNQMNNWGGFFDIDPDAAETHRQLLKFWARANTYALQNCQTWLRDSHLVVKFENLCSNSAEHVRLIADFLGLEDVDAATTEIQEKIVRQKSEGRYRNSAKPEMFDECDLETLGHFGFTADFRDAAC